MLTYNDKNPRGYKQGNLWISYETKVFGFNRAGCSSIHHI